MRTYFQSQCWITQQHIEDVMFIERNRPNGFDIISTLEDLYNGFERRSESSSSICPDFHQKHWWRIKHW